ncbi:MAG: hypothetical protein GY729_13825, partial [Desulfobacteraceae bacterium]|nr:hypothetical protein [Desulfobacteraceae bacterium]
MSIQKSIKLLLAAAAILFLFPFVAQTKVIVEEPGEMRSDILTIDIPSSDSHKDMPAVHFVHGIHSQAVEGQCIKCHEQKDGVFSFKFKRTENNLKGDAFMDLYHDNCTSCHEEMKKSKKKSGPLAAECRACHNAEFKKGSSWADLEFDRSLHFRHETTKEIKSDSKAEETNCSVCHHKYNKKTKKIYYQKGEEESCTYCHREKEIDDIRSARNASHDSCVACHLQLKEKSIKAGPVNCFGCHDTVEQDKIEVVKDIPRLKRNQPDAVLLTGWGDLGTNRKENKKIIDQHMKPVVFNHVVHEKANTSCKSCHHETLKKCNACHTEKGEEKGGFLKIGQAMHVTDSNKSCIGCHNQVKIQKECAGCHFQMPNKALKDYDCESCHSFKNQGRGASIFKNKDETDRIAQSLAAIRNSQYTKVAEKDIPETVVIKTIANEYKASEFPHRMVVKAIFEKVGKNNMAKAFHGNEKELCMGCHHNSP